MDKFSAFERVSILSEALPYLQEFQGKTIVIKYGGAAMKDPTLKVPIGGLTARLSFMQDKQAPTQIS